MGLSHKGWETCSAQHRFLQLSSRAFPCAFLAAQVKEKFRTMFTAARELEADALVVPDIGCGVYGVPKFPNDEIPDSTRFYCGSSHEGCPLSSAKILERGAHLHNPFPFRTPHSPAKLKDRKQSAGLCHSRTWPNMCPMRIVPCVGRARLVKFQALLRNKGCLKYTWTTDCDVKNLTL